MRKIWLTCIGILFITGGIYWLYQNQEVESQSKGVLYVERETEKYKQDCFKQAYPEDLSSINMYNDEMKCLDKIDELNQFEESVLSLYWDLYNREDYGVMGRGVNDATLGRYYEHLLSDIINFEYISTYPRPA